MNPTHLAEDDPTRELTTAGGGDRCTNCQAPLASDQRYCVNCGERRGSTRVSFAAATSHAAPQSAPTSVQPPRQPRGASGMNFIAGVATLLLAMGVGVLIGQGINKNTKTTPIAASAPVIKIVGGGSGSGSGAGGGGGSSIGRRRGRRHASKTPTLKLSKKVNQAVNNAANNVLGSGAKNLAPATVQPGQSCSGGAGCQNHKFTGNFFGQ